MTWANDMALGNSQDWENMFEWLIVVICFTGTPTYNCFRPWVYKDRSDGSIGYDLFVYVNYVSPIGPTEEVCWEASRKWGSMHSWLGIQDASRKLQGPLQ